MNRKIILLNLALLALTAALGWQARRHYLDMKAHEREVLQRTVSARQVLPPPPAPQPVPVAPMQYVDVAQKTLFSKDRNPNVIIEVPPPKPEPPLPALPTYFGQIGIGDKPIIFLSIGNGAQKRFQAGDKVGDFQLVAFDRERITLGWNDKKVERKLEDLKAKVDQAPAAPLGAYQAPPPPSAPNSASGSRVKAIGGSASDPSKPDSAVGTTISGTDFRGCVAGDTTPAGTVVDGYRKMTPRTLMGNSCFWEKVK
jgi:hypothetical protein